MGSFRTLHTHRRLRAGMRLIFYSAFKASILQSCSKVRGLKVRFLTSQVCTSVQFTCVRNKNLSTFRPASLELLEFSTGTLKQGHCYLTVIYDFEGAHNQTLAILLLIKADAITHAFSETKALVRTVRFLCKTES